MKVIIIIITIIFNVKWCYVNELHCKHFSNYKHKKTMLDSLYVTDTIVMERFPTGSLVNWRH